MATAYSLARQIGARLAAGETEALLSLVRALHATNGNLEESAHIIGLAGASSLWRIAYRSQDVRIVLAKLSRRPGNPKPKQQRPRVRKADV